MVLAADAPYPEYLHRDDYIIDRLPLHPRTFEDADIFKRVMIEMGRSAVNPSYTCSLALTLPGPVGMRVAEFVGQLFSQFGDGKEMSHAEEGLVAACDGITEDAVDHLCNLLQTAQIPFVADLRHRTGNSDSQAERKVWGFEIKDGGVDYTKDLLAVLGDSSKRVTYSLGTGVGHAVVGVPEMEGNLGDAWQRLRALRIYHANVNGIVVETELSCFDVRP
jgi:hypothetical protein